MTGSKKEVKKVLPGFGSKGYLTQRAWTTLQQLVSDGISVSEIARKMNISRPTVRYWRDAKHCPRASTAPCAGTAAPAKKSKLASKKKEARKKLVARALRQKDARGVPKFNSCTALRKYLAKFGVTCSKSSVWYDLYELGYASRCRGKSPRLTVEKKERRVAFARRMKNLGQHIWFSDEKLFDCNDHEIRMWCPDGERASQRCTERFTAGAHVWGVIGIGFKKLVFLGTDRVDAKGYIDTLRHYLVDSFRRAKAKDAELQFMQDGAPAHTAKATMQFLQEKEVDMVTGWPPTSPDLNPIENLWALLAQKVSKELPRTAAELQSAVELAWNEIPQALIDNLINSFESRCEKCIDLKGEKVQK